MALNKEYKSKTSKFFFHILYFRFYIDDNSIQIYIVDDLTIKRKKSYQIFPNRISHFIDNKWD